VPVFAALEKFLTVISSDDHQGIIQNSHLLKSLKQPPEVMISVQDLAIILVKGACDPFPILRVGDKLQWIHPSRPDRRAAAVIKCPIIGRRWAIGIVRIDVVDIEEQRSLAALG
jgi:hypothetical protein